MEVDIFSLEPDVLMSAVKYVVSLFWVLCYFPLWCT